MKKIRGIKIDGDFVFLNPHHFDVLRIKEGEKVKVLLPDGNFAVAEVIDEKSKKAKVLEIIKPIEKKVKITCAIPLLKKEKTEKIVEFLSLIGVEEIIILITQRGEVKPTKDKQEKIKERLKRISLENSRISGVKTPKIEGFIKLEDLAELDFQEKIVFWENSSQKITKEIIEKIFSKSGNLIFAVGPEGGFAEEEIELLRKFGWKDFTIGEKILTAELFPVYMASIFDFFAP